MKQIALAEIKRIRKAILLLENFGIEDSAECYLLKYPSRTRDQAFKYAERMISPQIKILKNKLYDLELFIDIYTHLDNKVNFSQELTWQELKMTNSVYN